MVTGEAEDRGQIALVRGLPHPLGGPEPFGSPLRIAFIEDPHLVDRLGISALGGGPAVSLRLDEILGQFTPFAEEPVEGQTAG